MNIQFWFDFASTYSYPAALRIEALAARQGVEVLWRPFLLGPILSQQGWNNSPFSIYPAKGHYMWRDVERVCMRLQLPFKRPSVFPRNGLLPARVACHYAQAPWQADFIQAVFRANFEHDLDIANPAVIASCLQQLGQDADEVLAQAQHTEAKEKLRAQTGEAAQLGIFGAPSMRVGEELFWGNDRLEDALQWCVEHPATA